MFRRLLIANRGEIAVRVIRACQEMGIEAIAVFSEADADALHVRLADRALPIGGAPATDSYLRIDRVIAAARESGAEAIHPGYGFLSENDDFATACIEAGIAFVGPPPAALRLMGSKIEARRVAEQSGVPVVPGGVPDDQSDEALSRAASRAGYPVLLKPAAGGGGIGMKEVRDAAGMVDAAAQARREALAAFGDATLYVERLIERPRHIEIQFIADTHGHVVHLFERECSLQRRHQKVVEESPSAAVTPALRARLGAAALALARAAGYENAGTAEFLVDGSGDSAEFYFLEVNARLQVEHPVTESVSGVDLVRAQIGVAAGEPLRWTQRDLQQRGHAIELRIYAEDPQTGFLPQAGRLTRFRPPSIPGVRVDSGFAEGAEVPVHYDPLLAKLIASGETRTAARRRAIVALRNFPIDGIVTNTPYLLQILEHPRFIAGELDTHFLTREHEALTASLPATPPTEGETEDAEMVTPADPWDYLGERKAPARRQKTVDRRQKTGDKSGADLSLSAPMPATVTAIHVKQGQTVERGDTLLTLEAMKMELPIKAPYRGVVRAIACQPGELVQPGIPLVELAE